MKIIKKTQSQDSDVVITNLSLGHPKSVSISLFVAVELLAISMFSELIVGRREVLGKVKPLTESGVSSKISDIDDN
jgi:hypothetical protein